MTHFLPCVACGYRSLKDPIGAENIHRVLQPLQNSAELSCAVKADEEIKAIREHLLALNAEAEGCSEMWWARLNAAKICGSDLSPDLLAELPLCSSILALVYLEKIDSPACTDDVNLAQQTRIETSLLQSVGAQLTNIAFIGSGSTPFTSLSLAHNHLTHGQTLTNVDMDADANVFAAKLCATLLPPSNVSPTFKFVTSKAEDLDGAVLGGVDVVYVAAFVGLTSHQKSLLALHMLEHMRPGAYLLMRTADGVRSLLFAEVDPDEILRGAKERGIGAEFVLVSHPKNRELPRIFQHGQKDSMLIIIILL
jgi:hypothetical protein